MQQSDQEKLEQLKKEIYEVRNPFQVLCNFCNRITNHFDETSEEQWPMTYEVLKKLYDEERFAIKASFKRLMEEVTLLDEDADDLLDQAKDLINPDAD